MGNHGTNPLLQLALVLGCTYIGISLVTGTALLLAGIASFGAGFALTALWMGGLGCIIWKDMR